MTVDHLDPILGNMNNDTTLIIGDMRIEKGRFGNNIVLRDDLSTIISVPVGSTPITTMAHFSSGTARVGGQEVGFAGFSDY